MGGRPVCQSRRRLPAAEWTEADPDYRGGKRKRQAAGASARQRFVTTFDHYQTFVEIPACQ